MIAEARTCAIIAGLLFAAAAWLKRKNEEIDRASERRRRAAVHDPQRSRRAVIQCPSPETAEYLNALHRHEWLSASRAAHEANRPY